MVTFLEIVVDTSRFELRLLGDKLVHMRSLVRQWQERHSGRHKDFESLLGHLSHAATVIRQGRIFLRHLFSILKAPCPSGFVHLDVAARADLLRWEYFLVRWNGTMLFSMHQLPPFMFTLMHPGRLVAVVWCHHLCGFSCNGHSHGPV